MRKTIISLVATLFILSGLSVSGSAAIKGDYMEVRSADVYTGACIANSEVGLAGNEAILAWKVTEGTWKGVNLAGLGVVGVVKAQATLGDPYHTPYPAKSVMILDSRATADQRAALQDFAASNADGLLDHIVRVETAPIQMTVEHGDQHGVAKLVAGNFASIETRSLCAGDHMCGNEFVYYPPLVNLTHSMPAFTLDDTFSGQGLNVVWKYVDRRSAFVGAFVN
jgi:hypothetical protein